MSSQADAPVNDGNTVAAREENAAKAMLKAERKRHRAAVQQFEHKIRDLETSLKERSASFEEINKKLASTLPQAPVSDIIIRFMYRDLCESVEDWVSLNCHDISNVAERIKKENLPTEFHKMVTPLLDDGASWETAGSYPQCAEDIIAKILMRFLFECILRRSSWFPDMPSKKEGVFNKVMDHLHEVYPEKGPDFREQWRCDTYKALAAAYKNNSISNKYFMTLTEVLSQLMSNLLNKNIESIEIGLSEIVGEAMAFADNLKRCPVQYCFVYPIMPQMSVRQRILKRTLIKNFHLINASTGERMKEIFVGVSMDEVPSSEVLCTILPSLVKIMADGAYVTLAQGVVIVKFQSQDNAREVKASEAPVIEEVETNKVEDKEHPKQVPGPALPAKPAAVKTWADVVRM